MADAQSTAIEAAAREEAPAKAQTLITKALNLVTLLTVMRDASELESGDRDALQRCFGIAESVSEEVLSLACDLRDTIERKGGA